jgi:hypothetical protein
VGCEWGCEGGGEGGGGIFTIITRTIITINI